MQDAPLTQTFYGLPRPSPIRRAARSLTPGGRKRGQPAVVGELAQLEAEGYRIIPQGALGHDPMDHLLVGPTGVFLVRVNRWRGRFSVRRDGWFRHSRKDAGELVWQMTRRATAVKAQLGKNGSAPQVEGIVVVSRSRMQNPVIQMGWVTFVAAPRLVRYVRSRRSALSTEQVDQLTADVPA